LSSGVLFRHVHRGVVSAGLALDDESARKTWHAKPGDGIVNVALNFLSKKL
jgi:hypothetical protein